MYKSTKEVVRTELNAGIEDARFSFICKEKKKAIDLANVKRKEGLAVAVRYNNNPNYFDLDDSTQRDIALLFVNFKVHETGDSAWFIDPLTFEDIAQLTDALIRNSDSVEEDVSARFASEYTEQITEYYNNYIS